MFFFYRSRSFWTYHVHLYLPMFILRTKFVVKSEQCTKENLKFIVCFAHIFMLVRCLLLREDVVATVWLIKTRIQAESKKAPLDLLILGVWRI